MSAVPKPPVAVHYEQMSRDYLVSLPVPKSATLHSYEQDGITMYYLRFGWNLLDGVVFLYLHGTKESLTSLEEEGGTAIVLASVNEMVLDDGRIYSYLNLDLDNSNQAVEYRLQVLQHVSSTVNGADVYQLAHAPQSLIAFVADKE